MSKLYHCTEENEIKGLLFGRKVEKVSDDELLLDNGIILKILPNEGCGGCANGWYDLTELNGCDNAITDVELDCESTDGYCDGYSYKIFVFTEDKKIKLAQIDGNDGNGYYGSGYDILIKIKKKVDA